MKQKSLPGIPLDLRRLVQLNSVRETIVQAPSGSYSAVNHGNAILIVSRSFSEIDMSGGIGLDRLPSIERNLSAIPSDSEESQRKLWIDYIRRLSDRHTASIGRSGASTWALFGVLAGILYTCVPHLLSFFASPKNWKNQLVLLTLGTDMVMFFLVAYALLAYYCMGGMEGRALTESNRRLRSVSYLGIIFLELGLALAHSFAARVADVYGFVFRGVVLLFGLFWAAEAVLKIRSMVRNIRRARKHHIPLPWFAGVAIDADRTAAVSSALLLLLSVASFAAMVWYLHSLVHSGADWVKPLAASGYSIAFACAATVLVMRGLHAIGAIPYDSLENEILFENLSSAEIKERFTRYILGSSAAEWLAQQTKLLKEADKARDEMASSVDAKLREIQASRHAKSAEELHGDVVELLKTVGEAVQRHKEAIEQHRFLIGEFAHSLGGQRKTSTFDLVVSDWKAQLTQMVEAAKSSSELRKRLVEFSQSVSGVSIPK